MDVNHLLYPSCHRENGLTHRGPLSDHADSSTHPTRNSDRDLRRHYLPCRPNARCAGRHPAHPESPNDRENPLVPLPDVPIDHDAVVVTHRHRDHFDDAARNKLDADVPLFCQPEEADDFREEGFTDVRPVDNELTFEGVTLIRTPAQHGHGTLAEEMGPASGFVFSADRSLYLVGNTVWYDGASKTLDMHQPDAVIVNAGAAQFVDGRPITMDEDDVRSVRAYVNSEIPVVADHMDAINHCLLTRQDLHNAVDGVTIPADGESLVL